ncbi:3023_t:CDS:1, partial [Cetraspora pellucida]
NNINDKSFMLVNSKTKLLVATILKQVKIKEIGIAIEEIKDSSEVERANETLIVNSTNMK